jgi:S-adenosylmethionine/arginine decarboxylase-like enzyme
MDIIKKWLANGKVYKVGVAIYNQLGTDLLLKKLFTSEAETPYKRDRLTKALQEIANTSTAQVKEIDSQKNEQSTAVATVANFTKIWPRETCKDATETELWNQAVLLLKERSHLHSLLFSATSDDQRREIAFRLLRKDERLDKVYADREYYQKNKHLPDQKDKPQYVTDPGIMVTRIANLQRYINRVKKTLTQGPNADAQARLEEFVKEYNHYAKIVGKEEVKC